MLKIDGNNLKSALDLISPTLTQSERDDATRKASQIVSAIVDTYNTKVKSGEVGKNGTGSVGDLSNNSFCAGLVYGRIQSGKTRAMITSAALAFDNKFKIVVVITTNNNRLVDQTYIDFQNGLPDNIRVYSKTHFKNEIDQAKQILTSNNGSIVIVCSKGTSRLEQLIDFLEQIGAKSCPAIIFDDEGDQATLDTNVFKRSTKEPLIAPSRTHQLIHDKEMHSLREALPRHIFVSVTGTPSGIILQNFDNRSRPSFVELLEPGNAYVGGEVFFSNVDPTNNKLISLIHEDERVDLLNGDNGLPEGLKQSVRFFLLAAAAAKIKIGLPPDNKGYKFLCHPSVKTSDQEKVAKLIRHYLDDLTGAFSNPSHYLRNDLENTYNSLKLQNPEVPEFNTLLKEIDNNIVSREINLLNKNTTGDELTYSKYFNFFIGGNTLGRGLAIKKLLVTYYVREAKRTQMDTMYQHARMFGYRKDTIPYTRVFLPPQLYARFNQIFVSDESLRKFIEKNKGSLDSFPIRIAPDIKPTRKGVLDAIKVDVLLPGGQLFPNYPYFDSADSDKITATVFRFLKKLFPSYEDKEKGRKGIKITIRQAKRLISQIKTNGTNTWSDKRMPMIVSYLGQEFKSSVLLKFREAERTAKDSEGLLPTGILSGSDASNDSQENFPVLWLFKTTFKEENKPPRWNGNAFIYPTLVIPEKSPLVVFNKS